MTDTPEMRRPSWEEYALLLARVASLRSEDPYARVGACALDHGNRVIGVAYNGLKGGVDAQPDFWADRDKRRPFMVHAEVNLLSLFRRGEARLIAVTLLPCASCATMIATYGIPKVVYGRTYERDERALEIFKFYNIELVQLDTGLDTFASRLK
jgi:dCMP deaminase